MLNHFRMIFAQHLGAISSGLARICQERFASIFTFMVLAFSLAIPTLLWVVTLNLEHTFASWKNRGEIYLYLDQRQSETEQKSLLNEVANTSGVGQAILKSPEEGLAQLQQQSGLDDLALSLPENPLPAVIIVTPELRIDTTAKLEQLYHSLKILTGIDDAKFDLQWVSSLYAMLEFAKKINGGLILFLVLAAIFTVGNTIRMSVYNHHEEILVLKLIGASDAFVIRPFLYTGLWYGFFAAIIAAAIVQFILANLNKIILKVATIYQVNIYMPGLAFRQVLLLLIFATILGWLGAKLSVRRQLSLIEL